MYSYTVNVLASSTDSYIAQYVLVAKLVRDGVGQRQAGIFIDVTRAVWLTQSVHLRQSQRATRLIHLCADVTSAK